MGRGPTDRRDDVLPVRHRGFDRAVGGRPSCNGRGARPLRRDHRGAGGGSRRPLPEVDGRGRLDGLGVRVGASGARCGGCRQSCPARGAVARWTAPRRPLRTEHRRGRTPRSRLPRPDPEPRRAASRTGRRRPGLRLRGDDCPRGPAPACRLRARRPRSASVERRARAAEDPRSQGARGQRAPCPRPSPRTAVCSPSSPTTGGSSSDARASSTRSSPACHRVGCLPSSAPRGAASRRSCAPASSAPSAERS